MQLKIKFSEWAKKARDTWCEKSKNDHYKIKNMSKDQFYFINAQHDMISEVLDDINEAMSKDQLNFINAQHDMISDVLDAINEAMGIKYIKADDDGITIEQIKPDNSTLQKIYETNPAAHEYIKIMKNFLVNKIDFKNLGLTL